MPNAYDGQSGGLGFRMPGRALRGVMIGLLAIWLIFAVGINWGGASEEVFLLFCGNAEAILSGQLWRLVTAPLLHAPSGTIGHILFALLGLFFLAPVLEESWGSARLLRFLLFSGMIAYAVQLLLLLLLPAHLGAQLVPSYWFGAMPVIEAVAVAWALSFRGQTVRLWLMIPVTSQSLLIFIVAVSLLRVIAATQAPEGLLSPFGGILAGWLLGGGTPSPLRRLYLKVRLLQLDREASQGRSKRAAKARQSGLRVIDGGRSESGRGGRTLH